MGNGSFFLGKKKEPKKNRLGLSADTITYIRFRGYGFFIREAARICRFNPLTRYESAAGGLLDSFYYPTGRYLERFGIPRIGFAGLGRLRPRRVHRHASGAAHSYFGALSALNHKSELSAERYRPAAIRLYERRCFARANHIFELAREGRYGRRASVFVGYTLGERHSNNHAKIIRRQAPVGSPEREAGAK